MTNTFFRLRHFIALMMFCCFTIMAVSGLTLFSAPGESGWSFLGMGFHEWIGIHVIFAFIFIISAFFHITLNFKSLTSYLRNRITAVASAFSLSRLKLEPFIAVLLCAFLLTSVIQQFPPATYIRVLHDKITSLLHPGGVADDD